MGEGDMLFSPVGALKPIRIQGPFVSTAEVKKVVKFIREQREPEYELDLKEINSREMSPGDSQRDSLYPEAVRLIVESEQASISLLQRRLSIGYTRAARLIDAMEEDGVIGPFAGSKPRKVLLSPSELPRFLEEIEKIRMR